MWGAIGSLAGGALQAAGSLFGSKKSNDFANAQLAYQKELAQNQIQWRVEDAKKAGLHPLAALGVSPSSYSPVSGGTSADFSGLAQGLADAGQNIDRAVQQGKDRDAREKAEALQDKQIALDMKGKDLNNQILETELASKRFKLQQQMFPPTPSTKGLDPKRYAIPGQPGSKIEPRKADTVDTGDTKYQFMQNPDGTYDLMPGNDYKQVYEDIPLLEALPILQTNIRDWYNRIFGQDVDGMHWSWSRWGWLPNTKRSRVDVVPSHKIRIPKAFRAN